MSDTASRELSEKLCELSGWNDTDKVWHKIWNPLAGTHTWNQNYRRNVAKEDVLSASYTAGYLLRKLPTHYNDQWLRLAPITDDRWAAYYIQSGVKTAGQDEWSDTPEDALCKLAIQLHKEGILPISGRD